MLKDKNPAVRPGHKWIAVVSANGKTQLLKISKPTSVLDEDGEAHTAELVISPDCPVNLLGRDLMKQLRIALVPTKRGMRPEKMTSAYVHEGRGTPKRFFALDLATTGPRSVVNHLLKYIPEKTGIIPQKEWPLHVTMLYERPEQPRLPMHVDPFFDNPFENKVNSVVSYEEQFKQLGPQTVTVDYVYATQRGDVAATVKLPDPIKTLYKGYGKPHVSLARSSDTRGWYQLGCLVTRLSGLREEKWSPGPYGDECTLEGVGKVTRTGVHWVTVAKPTIHLDA